MLGGNTPMSHPVCLKPHTRQAADMVTNGTMYPYASPFSLLSSPFSPFAYAAPSPLSPHIPSPLPSPLVVEGLRGVALNMLPPAPFLMPRVTAEGEPHAFHWTPRIFRGSLQPPKAAQAFPPSRQRSGKGGGGMSRMGEVRGKEGDSSDNGKVSAREVSNFSTDIANASETFARKHSANVRLNLNMDYANAGKNVSVDYVNVENKVDSAEAGNMNRVNVRNSVSADCVNEGKSFETDCVHVGRRFNVDCSPVAGKSLKVDFGRVGKSFSVDSLLGSGRPPSAHTFLHTQFTNRPPVIHNSLHHSGTENE
ncbi:hypothetical protein ACOMHN_009856 [Nucella lapillus]